MSTRGRGQGAGARGSSSAEFVVIAASSMLPGARGTRAGLPRRVVRSHRRGDGDRHRRQRPCRSLRPRDRAVERKRRSRRSTMLGAFAVPRRPAWMIGLAAHRLRNLPARRRRRLSARRIAEPRHDRAEGAESNGNSETNQPTAMLSVNGASRLGGVVVRFIHGGQYARVRAVKIRVFELNRNGH